MIGHILRHEYELLYIVIEGKMDGKEIEDDLEKQLTSKSCYPMQV